MALRYYRTDKGDGTTEELTELQFAERLYLYFPFRTVEAIIAQANEQALDGGASNPINTTFAIYRVEDDG